MRATLLLAVVVLPFAACSGIKNFELGVHGSTQLNPNDDKQPTPVRVKVLRLKGAESADAFRNAAFDDLWGDTITAAGVVVEGQAQYFYVPARNERVPVQLQQVPPEVTHIGVLGLFNTPVLGKDRVLLPRDQFGDVEIWLHESMMDTHAPGTTNPEAPKPEPAKAEPANPGSGKQGS
ncbi:MAG TPA: type VI secretion system lipoprotein TssJ [Planctomycetota bacterium]